MVKVMKQYPTLRNFLCLRGASANLRSTAVIVPNKSAKTIHPVLQIATIRARVRKDLGLKEVTDLKNPLVASALEKTMLAPTVTTTKNIVRQAVVNVLVKASVSKGSRMICLTRGVAAIKICKQTIHEMKPIFQCLDTRFALQRLQALETSMKTLKELPLA